MATDIPADDSSGSLGNLSLSDEDLCDDGALQDDTWIEELECALLADCDQATLKKICEGKRIPVTLRPDYWRALLALNDAGPVKLTNVFDLSNQDELRRDCELLVEDISTNLAQEPLSDSDKLRLKSDFESTLTTYVKARPELSYVSGNGWTDILKVLYNLQLSDTQLYQMFFRIVDRYIPRDLSPSRSCSSLPGSKARTSDNVSKPTTSSTSADSSKSKSDNATMQAQRSGSQNQQPQRDVHEKRVQAYQLLRLLIQYHDPELCSILDSRKVTHNMYVKDWFCSLFARSCEPKLALYIWDMHFKMADPFLIFFAAIVMVVNASDELKKANNQADMLSALKRMPSQLEEDDIEDLYYLVSNHYTNSTPRSIRSYSHLFFMDTFGSTYSGNESPEDGGSPTFVDLKTCRLTSSLDLSQFLCLPIVPAEIFALDTAQKRRDSSPTDQSPTSAPPLCSALRYFLVDCRPAEQYNAGHLTKAFHLDCSLMLREPSSFATAVQALLEIQRQVVASKSNTGGQHLCFIGSGDDEDDCYVNMVVASFLQKYQKYVSIVFGGFSAIHDYVQTKSELKDSFDKYVVDHNEDLCKACCSKSPEAYERLKMHQETIARSQRASAAAATASSGFSSAQSIFASTTNFFKSDKGAAGVMSKFTASTPQASATAAQLAQSGASMFDKFTTAFVSKSSVFKERLVETLNSTTLPTSNLAAASGGFVGSAPRSHVDSQDKLGRRYTGGSFQYDDAHDLPNKRSSSFRTRVGSFLPNQNDQEDNHEEPLQEIQVEQWQEENEIVALYKCAQIKGTSKFPGYIGLNRSHLWILREIPHNKGFASIAAKRPLDMVVQITSKRRQPDFIIFRYGYANNGRGGTNNSGGSPSGSPASQSPDVQSLVAAGTSQQDARTTAAGGTTAETPQAAGQQKNGLPTIIASDHLHIPQAFEVIRLIKREIVRIMDESSRKASSSSQVSEKTPSTADAGGSSKSDEAAAVQDPAQSSTRVGVLEQNRVPAPDEKPNKDALESREAQARLVEDGPSPTALECIGDQNLEQTAVSEHDDKSRGPDEPESSENCPTTFVADEEEDKEEKARASEAPTSNDGSGS